MVGVTQRHCFVLWGEVKRVGKKTYKKTRLDIYICKSTLTLSEFSPQSTGRDLAGSP